MTPFQFSPCPSLNGSITIPGDKSITHRALILSALAFGTTVIDNVPDNDDCRATMDVLRQFGIEMTARESSGGVLSVSVNGNGARGLRKPDGPVRVESSGTTFRLMLGVAAGQIMTVTFEAGSGLASRPMFRVIQPLRMMGAAITARAQDEGGRHEEYPPVKVTGGILKGIEYTLPVASAQVKSAILLAGLNAEGKTSVIEPVSTRDHTERMLRLFKAPLRVSGNTVSIEGGGQLVSPGSVFVPGDISSAAFFLVMGTLVPQSRVTIRRVSLNPSRTGIISVLRRMGADISFATEPDCSAPGGGEPAADVIARTAVLNGTVVHANEVPSLIDELPLLMVAACFARGESRFNGVQELRVKETDRISSMLENLRLMGAEIEVVSGQSGEDVVIKGSGSLRGASVKSYNDHRTAMSMIVAGMCARGETALDDVSCINKSFPGFVGSLKSLC